MTHWPEVFVCCVRLINSYRYSSYEAPLYKHTVLFMDAPWLPKLFSWLWCISV